MSICCQSVVCRHAWKHDQVLRKGTERGYRAIDFTTTGEKLASVGQAPDFMLTVWDWVNEKVILHCKAFGQDVAKVTEAPGIRQASVASATTEPARWVESFAKGYIYAVV